MPPAPVARQAVVLAESLGEGWNVQAAARMHVTLAITKDFAAGYPADVASALETMGGRIASAPVAILLDRLSIGTESVALRPGKAIAGLTNLHRAIRREWAGTAVPWRSDWTFSPHMTLGYGREHRPVVRPIEGLGWDATELVLIHSKVGQTRHRTLGRWPLKAAQFELF
ncbi:MAG: 2'-5' RNA ligase family protein [Sphingobium sp.]